MVQNNRKRRRAPKWNQTEKWVWGRAWLIVWFSADEFDIWFRDDALLHRFDCDILSMAPPKCLFLFLVFFSLKSCLLLRAEGNDERKENRGGRGRRGRRTGTRKWYLSPFKTQNDSLFILFLSFLELGKEKACTKPIGISKWISDYDWAFFRIVGIEISWSIKKTI